MAARGQQLGFEFGRIWRRHLDSEIVQPISTGSYNSDELVKKKFIPIQHSISPCATSLLSSKHF